MLLSVADFLNIVVIDESMHPVRDYQEIEKQAQLGNNGGFIFTVR